MAKRPTKAARDSEPRTGRFQFRPGDYQSDTAAVAPATLLALAQQMLADMQESADTDANPLRLVDSRLSFHDLSWCERLDAAMTAHHAGPAIFWEAEFYAASGNIIAKATFTTIVEAEKPSAEERTGNAPAAPTLSPGKAENALASDRREIIANAAVAIIAEKGFAAASMREIAAAAGMHVPTMYQYVKSKDEVLELVYRWVINRVRENLAPALALDLPIDEKIEAMLSRMVSGMEPHRRATGVLNRETRSLSRAARHRVLAEYAEILSGVSDMIAKGIEDGTLRKVDPLLMANFIDAIWDTWSLRQFAYGAYDIETFTREATDFILKGLLDKPAAASIAPR